MVTKRALYSTFLNAYAQEYLYSFLIMLSACFLKGHIVDNFHKGNQKL